MVSSINNIARSLCKIAFPSPSDSEVLENCYQKSRQTSIDVARSHYNQEDLYYTALSEAQETEFYFFKKQEEEQIESGYSFVGGILAQIGSIFTEKEKPPKPLLQYQFKRLWMVLSNVRTDSEIRDYDAVDNLDAIVQLYKRDIVKNEASRLYKFYQNKFKDLEHPYRLSNLVPKLQAIENQKFRELQKFPILWSPCEHIAKKQAEIQLGKDIKVGVVVAVGAVALTAMAVSYATPYFTKKP